MTNNDPKHPQGETQGEGQGDGQGEDHNSDALRALLKQSLSTPNVPTQVLPEVQRKLRERSRGKFYGTAWSQSPPSKSAIAISIVLLLAAAIAMWALAPKL